MQQTSVFLYKKQLLKLFLPFFLNMIFLFNFVILNIKDFQMIEICIIIYLYYLINSVQIEIR